MTKDEVITSIKEKLSELLDGVSVEIKVFNKNNNTNYIGVVFSKSDGNFNISPIIDISDIVDDVIDDDLSAYDASKKVCQMYKEFKIDTTYELNLDDIYNTVFCELINYNMNTDLLQKIPHKRFLDLAIVYRFKPSIELVDGSVLITDDIMSHFNIEQYELDALAMRKIKATSYKVASIMNFISEMIDIENIPESVSAADDIMYVCTNKEAIFGANALLCKDIFRTFDCDLYIIPSSVHELIIVPSTPSMSAETIKDMIKEVNDTQADERDILSYSLYIYDRAKDSIRIS